MDLMEKTLSALAIGEAVFHENLAVLPLSGESHSDPPLFALDDALAAGLARIEEVSQSGSVPELRFVNAADIPVLVVDGEEFVGAKQNRIANLTLIVPARSSVVIPVSCVEAGRWHDESVPLRSVDRVHFAEGRARKTAQVNESMAAFRRPHSNQSEVWGDIGRKMDRLAAHSETDASEVLYESRRAELGGFKKLTPQEGQVGAIFLINGRAAGIELFDRGELLKKLFSKLITSYGIDAVDRTGEEWGGVDAADGAAFLDRVSKCDSQSYEAAFVGTDIRLSGDGVTGAALEANGHLVHLCGFAMRDGRAGHRRDGRSTRPRMRRPSHRAASVPDFEDDEA